MVGRLSPGSGGLPVPGATSWSRHPLKSKCRGCVQVVCVLGQTSELLRSEKQWGKKVRKTVEAAGLFPGHHLIII
jgi:hypothetical protein